MALRIESQLVHAPGDSDPRFGDVVAPIHLATTYQQPAFGQPLVYDYSRSGNPSRQVVEDQIAALEGAGLEGAGLAFASGGLAFASGMAAITAVLALFEPGDELLVPTNLYGGTFRILERHFKRYGLQHRFADFTQPDAVDANFSTNTRALLFESPTNPLLEVADIAALSAIAHSHGALAIVDNTFLTPCLQRPLALGADIVIHSATKYLGGHSDVLAGLTVCRDPKLQERLHFIQYSTGGVLSPFDCYLLTRGIKTLALRLERGCDNALGIAEYLENDRRCSRIIYPGLPSHPGFAVQQRQAKAAGTLLAFELAAPLDAQRFAQRLQLITLAESLGAVESLICHPATMTHASIPAGLRQQMGISDRLLRLSVGIEHVDDLIADIDQALG